VLPLPMERVATDRSKKSRQLLPLLIADFCNKICQLQTLTPVAHNGKRRCDYRAVVCCSSW